MQSYSGPIALSTHSGVFLVCPFQFFLPIRVILLVPLNRDGNIMGVREQPRTIIIIVYKLSNNLSPKGCGRYVG